MGLVYSSAPEAAAKRALDNQLLKENTPGYIKMDSESYLRDLIRYGSNGKKEVRDKARGLQFFIVRGGGEGFLGDWAAGLDASRYGDTASTTTSGGAGN